MNNGLKDLLLILKDKNLYKEEIFNRYSDVLNGFEDLIGDSHDDVSTLFYLVNRHFLYLLDSDSSISVREKDILFRRYFYNLLKVVGPKMLGCKQVIENRNYLNDPSSMVEDSPIKLPEKPVIFAANHGFRDDVLASVLAANRHAYIYWGSLPQFYNTFDGLSASLVGQIMVNRKNKASKVASVDKVLKVMDYGTDILMFPEGGWNKTSEVLVTNLWKGIYDFSCMTKSDVVPITHYVRDMEIVSKKNIIHSVVDDPIPLYEMSQKEALEYLRDVLSSWQFKMAELYGRTTREEELEGFSTSDDKWHDSLKKRMQGVSRYDSTIEKHSDYRPKDIIRSEDVFRPIANIQNITPENAKMIEDAKRLVKTREYSEFQKLY